ncbi:MAG: AAA family ATPase [Desulfatiglans sp.]|nr:AAA family ATPase [Desulfatiglans sp.]
MDTIKMKTAHDEQKYLEHFGLHSNPFPVAPDVQNFFFSDNIDRLITELVHGILTRKGFMVLTGEIGLGKTTTCHKILNILNKRGVETSLVFHTAYQGAELLREINRDFGRECDSTRFGDQMKCLNDFLLEANQKNKNCAIIIDDAQNLNAQSLELIRMISNLEADQHKLVQILLIGQPELMEKLNSPELRQLKSRLIIREQAQELRREELKNYLLFKLNKAGNRGRTIVSNRAIRKIYQLTKGNFRRVNTLMDRCLYAAFLYNTTEINKRVVADGQKDLFPRPFQWKRSFAWSSLAAVLLVVVTGFVYDNVSNALRTSYSWPRLLTGQSAPVTLDNEDHRAIVRLSIEDPKNREIDSVEEEERGEGNPPNSDSPTPVVAFLDAYELSQYKQSFLKALKVGRFQELTKTIYEQTGYYLVRLASLPDSIQTNYGILAYPLGISGKENYFVFWRPMLRVLKFYYGYRGKEIETLQVMLAEENLYSDRLDGIVGKRLMRAVVLFQKQMDLPVTGFPDEKTLFLLTQTRRDNGL